MVISKDSVHLEYKNIYCETSSPISFPIFQRGYTWKKEQTQNLLEDIMLLAYEPNEIRKGKQFYLLDFIWYEENGVKKIADGQQRIVTLNIFIRCINEYLEKSSLPFEPLRTFDLSYDDEDAQKKYEQFNIQRKNAAPFTGVYKYFTNFIENYKDYVPAIIDVIQNNIFVYFKKAKDIDDAFEIFKQINSGGRPLTKDDIIKTTLVQYSNKYDLSLSDFQFKDVKNLIISYYKLLERNTSSNFDNLAIMSFMNKNIVNNKAAFKQFYDYLQAVKNINTHSIFYVIQYLTKTQLLNVLYILGLKNIDVSQKREYLEEVLLPLCLISVIWKIKKTNPGGVASSLFVKVIDAIKADKTATGIRSEIINFVNENADICKITLSDFTEGLDANLDRKAKKALLIMDVIQSNTSGILNVPAINLEHIFPQNPSDDWVLNGWPGNSEEAAELADNIGNYMLLCEAVNKKVQNKYITYKRAEYDRIIPMDVMLQTPINTVDFERFEEEKDRYIRNRQFAIAKAIQQNFFFGKMLITD